VQNFIARSARRASAESAVDLRLNTPELKVAVNRDKLGDVGVSVETVGVRCRRCSAADRSALQEGRGKYELIVQVAPRDAAGPRHQRHLRARRDGTMVQLANVVDVEEGVSPQSLNNSALRA